MKKTGSIVLKMVFIGVVVLVLVIADVIIGAKVKERDAYRQQAVSSIYDAAGGTYSSLCSSCSENKFQRA